MTRLLLCGITLCASPVVFAQPPASREQGAPQRTVTLTACVVRGGTNAQPITLSGAMIVPATDQPGEAASSPVPAPASSAATRPATATGTAGTPGAVGTSGTSGASGAASTSGTILAGTAPAGSSTSSVSGYRLSGADMSAWLGRRVQIVGSLVPAAPGAAPTTPSAIGTTRIGPDGSLVLPELRVVSVSPVTGDCPPR